MVEYMANLMKDLALFIMESGIFIGKSFFANDLIQLSKNWGVLLGFIMLFLIPLIIFRWGARVISHSTFTFLLLHLIFFISIPGTVIYLLCMHRLKIQTVENITL